MIDLHVLTLDDTDEGQLKQCLDSIDQAAERARLKVSVYMVDGIRGHIGQGRAAGYTLGNAPYVAHVDPDDWVHEDLFVELQEVLTDAPAAVTTGEYRVSDRHGTIPRPLDKHHIHIVRRTLALDVDWHSFPNFGDDALLNYAPGLHLAKCLYYYRVHESAGRWLRSQDPIGCMEERKRARKLWSLHDRRSHDTPAEPE